MVTGPEAGAVARAGSSVLAGVARGAAGRPAWPHMHEALLELHEILREWCVAARQTWEAVEAVRAGGCPEGAPSQTDGRYVPLPMSDIEGLLSPAPPVAQRWSRSRRRQAARRTLRSMMHVYCPELLQDFEQATQARAEWMAAHRARLRRLVAGGAAGSELDRLAEEAAGTLRALDRVRADLGRFLRERFPLGDGPG
ncbi:hypothetical protein [Streptomyces hoynatensis]|uniref:Uncharacterized protein n=1 Tax=Streptomyces hoynatensis TaxID=1141874 RepID=A0A3A9Z9N1_9ACTN|nr:hypothetical protein [Streptomyces hoynatensis]RKN44007.1 hypothetical protein D7294_10050 [Streptomyces hoynatensis]